MLLAATKKPKNIKGRFFTRLGDDTVLQTSPAGETVSAWIRRRRSNRPGNSQANGPQGDVTLESRRQVSRLTEGVNPQAGGRISQVTGQRGHVGFDVRADIGRRSFVRRTCYRRDRHYKRAQTYCAP